MPPVLTEEQQKQYYAEEGAKASPLSPLNWLSSQSSGGSGVFSSKQGESIVTKDIKPVITEGKAAFGASSQVEKPQRDPAEDDFEIGTEDVSEGDRELFLLKREKKQRERELQSELDDYNAALDGMSISQTEMAKAQINMLKEEMSRALRAQEDMNKFTESVYEQSGLRSGQARYAPEMNANMIREVKEYGQAKLSKINREYTAAIGAAIAEFEQKQYAKAAQKAELAMSLKQKAVTEVNEQIKRVAEIAEDNRKKLSLARTEQAVSSLIGEGVTDPNEVFSMLSELGFDATSEEVSGALKNLTLEGNAEKLPQDLQTFNYLKKSGMLPAGVTSLPESQQYFGFLNMMKLAEGGKLSNAASAFGGGGTGGGISIGKGASNDVEEQIIRTRLFSKLMNVLNKGTLSETDREIIDTRISQFRAAGMGEQEIMDKLSGFAVGVETPYNQKFRDLTIANTNTLDEQTQLMGKVSMLINSGNYQTAMQTLERVAMDNARKTDPDNYMGQATTDTILKRTQRIKELLGKAGIVGPVQGNFQNLLRQVKGPDATKIKAELTQLYSQFRQKNAGVNVTDSELRFLDPLFADIGDTKGNFLVKLNTFEQGVVDQHNSTRRSVGLPEISATNAVNPTARLSLYKGSFEHNPFQQSVGPSMIIDEDGNFDIPMIDWGAVQK